MGGETGGLGVRATVLPPLPAASRNHDHRLAATTTTTPLSTTTSHATMRWSMLWSEGGIRTPHLHCPRLLRLVPLLPQVLPKRLLVPVPCVHVPMTHLHADRLPHDAVGTRIIVESACRTTARCSTKTTNRCLPYSLPTDTVMVRGDTGPCPPLSIDSTSA